MEKWTESSNTTQHRDMAGVFACLEQHRGKTNHQTENNSIKVWGKTPKFRKGKWTCGPLCKDGKRLDLIAVNPLPYSVFEKFKERTFYRIGLII